MTGIQVKTLKVVQVSHFTANRGDSGRVWNDFYYPDAAKAEEAFSAELEENRGRPPERVTCLYDERSGTYYQIPEALHLAETTA